MIGKGQNKGSSSADGSQSWHQLAGPRRKRVNSVQAKRRRLRQILRLVIFGFFFVVVSGVIFVAYRVIQQREEPIQISTPSHPIESLMFETNGVLPDRWIGRVLGLELGMTMMEVDILELKERVEAEGQVMSATIERVFPSALKITVREREPVMRMAVQGSDGKTEQRIVASDGSIYRGVGYTKDTLARLPFVLPYQHPDGSYKPLVGIDHVAELLRVARRNQPNFYKTWKVVSLEHYSGDEELPGQIIEIRSTRVDRVLFGASLDFGQQLERLQVVFDHLARQGDPSVKRVDLSLRGAAAVQLSSGRVSSF